MATWTIRKGAIVNAGTEYESGPWEVVSPVGSVQHCRTREHAREVVRHERLVERAEREGVRLVYDEPHMRYVWPS